MEQRHHELWSSRAGFLLAAIGGAVGMGNIWRFPYMVGKNGGSAFVLVYLVCVVAVAIPILMAEFLIGRRGQQSPVNAMAAVAAEARLSPAWRGVGWLGMTAAFLVLSFFGPIAAWAASFIPLAASGALSGMSGSEAEATLKAVLHNPVQLVALNGLFLALTAFIVARGIKKGIEKSVKLLMPALFGLLIIMVGYAAVAGDFAAGLAFLFAPDFSAIDAGVVLEAVGQAFLSIGIASGIMMAYGAYVPSNISIGRAAATISMADALAALLAGLAIFPIVFATGLDPAHGPGLVFVIFPLALGGMPGGGLLGTLFFVLLVIATLTSSIGVLEPVVSWAEEKLNIRRCWGAVFAGIGAWVLGLASLLSFSVWKQFYPLAFIGKFREANLFALADGLISKIMLPMGGILIALFVGWRLSRDLVCEELGMGDGGAYSLWRFLLRYIAPAAVALIFVTGLI
ncbi:MAG: sodium-dependent transporter [Sphingomonadales bacterium]